MQTLHRDTQAGWVLEGGDGQTVYVILPHGTPYETVSLDVDPSGLCYKRISVAGMEYDILDD